MTTMKQLNNMVAVINRMLPRTDGRTYQIEYAYGRPRFILADDHGCGSGVSPRLPKGQLEQWLYAFMAGADAARRDQ